MSVRVRFAPSPTGSPHVGNIRTALFNHLFAKHHGGIHILRIEDTDRARFVEGCEEEIIESLLYIGVEWQEGVGRGGPHGPYHQSERKEQGIYQPIFDRLLESGHAYWAFDTPEELKEMREYQQINKQPIGYYGGLWRDATGAKVEEARTAGLPGVIRLKIPRDETIVLNDAIRGRVEISSNLVDDPVLIKNDGMPTYHFAAMVDDHLMEITHVFRGEEWISSAPKHITLFKSLGWDPPEFIHVPIIKGSPKRFNSRRRPRIVRLCPTVFPKPNPGSSQSLLSGIPSPVAKAIRSSKKAPISSTTSSYWGASCIVFGAPCMCMRTHSAPDSAMTPAISGSPRKAVISLIMVAPSFVASYAVDER